VFVLLWASEVRSAVSVEQAQASEAALMLMGREQRERENWWQEH